MESLLNRLEENQNWKDILRASCKNNGVPTSLTGQLTIIKARCLHKRFQKTYQKQSQKLKYYWGENQLKAFHWILICVSAVYNVKIHAFSEIQWSLLNEIFRSKERSVLEYEAAKLLNSKVKKTKPWTQQQEKMLIQIISVQGQNNRWNEVGRSLYWSSKRLFFRTGKQCRQRWLNHLDPKKKHGGWTKEQDLKLLDLADSQNRKWAKIVKSFDGQRTEHMIKNRFKSLIVKQKKTTPHIKKEQKIIEALKERLINNTFEKIQQEDSFDSEVSSQQNDDKISIGQKADEKEADAQFEEKIKTSISEEQKIIQMNNNIIEEQKQQSEKKHDNMDPNISNYFEDMPENRNQPFNGFKMFSPYCLAYTMGSNLTPTGLTPTYFSPPAFFMNSFTQNMLSFQKYLNNPDGQDNNN